MALSVNDDEGFSRDALDARLAEVQRRLADLRCIDLAAAYIDQRDVGQSFRGGRRHLGSVEVAGAESIAIPLGREHPFWRTLWLPQDPQLSGSLNNRRAVAEDLAGLAQTADDWASANITTLKWMTRPLTRSTAHLHAYIDSNLEHSYTQISRHVEDDLGQLKDSIVQWHGDAARNFRKCFYNPFDTVRSNQAWFVHSFRDAMAVVKAIADLSQNSIMNAVTGASSALEDQLKQRSVEYHGPSNKPIRIIAYITGIVAALDITPWVSIPSEIASISLYHAADGIPDQDGEDYEIDGVTAEELFNDLLDAIRRVIGNVDANYTSLETELRALDTEMNALRQQDPERGYSRLIPTRPELADGVDPDMFFHETSSRYP